MKQYKRYADERQRHYCIYCGINISSKSTREHIPSKVLLDKPYPENLPIILSCYKCNNNFSKDEEYIAYWLEILNQKINPKDTYIYKKIKRAFSRNKLLKAKIIGTNLFGSNELLSLNENIMEKVLLKQAKGHALFELNNPCYEKPIRLWWKFANSLTQQEIIKFNKIPYDDIIAPEP